MICPICLCESDTQIVHTMDSQKIHGNVVKAMFESTVCSLCNKEFWNMNQLEKNLSTFRGES